MDKEHLTDILDCLAIVKEGLFDDSLRLYAAFNLGMLMASIEITLDHMEQNTKEFGHT